MDSRVVNTENIILFICLIYPNYVDWDKTLFVSVKIKTSATIPPCFLAARTAKEHGAEDAAHFITSAAIHKKINDHKTSEGNRAYKQPFANFIFTIPYKSNLARACCPHSIII